MRSVYVIYKAKYAGRTYWRARFCWDEQSGKYLVSRNLGVLAEGKRERRREAEEIAEKIADELQREKNGDLKKPSLNVADIPLLSFLSSFWANGSDYIEEQALVNKTPLSAMYIKHNQDYIRLHISTCPLINNLSLSGLSRKIIREYKLWGAKRGMSGRLMNQCLQTMRVAVRRAVANGDLPADPFYGAAKSGGYNGVTSPTGL